MRGIGDMGIIFTLKEGNNGLVKLVKKLIIRIPNPCPPYPTPQHYDSP